MIQIKHTRGASASFIFLVGLSCSAFTQTQATDRTETSWRELVDEPSRAELFKKRVIPPSLANEKATLGTSLAIPPDFVFPTDARVDRMVNETRRDSIFGIDVSHYDPKSFHFDLLKLQGVSFVYVKATQGTNFKDGNFRTYWPALASLPPEDAISRGAYHFLSSGSPGRDQADAFVDYVNLHGGFKSNDLPPAVDLEWDVTTENGPDHWRGHSADDIIANTLACLRRIKERTNRTPVLYTATSWLKSRGLITISRFSELQAFPVWIADYDNTRKLSEKPSLPPKTRQVIWQFTSKAKFLPSIGTKVDASIFYGTPEQFKTAFQLP